MNFFAELKRRHIYRVAAAYAVLAWLLLQLVNNIAPVLDLPPWVARAFLLLLVIGFPVALFFAWMRELAPAALWSIWDQIPETQRDQAIKVLEAFRKAS